MKRFVFLTGVIAALVGAFFVARFYTNWRFNVHAREMNEDVDNLFLALQQFKENLGRYPVGASNAEIVKALKGGNPKNVIILVGKKAQLNDKGEFVDPWGTPFRIYFSDNGVLIRSAGPNRRFDDKRSGDSAAAECDDYFKSN